MLLSIVVPVYNEKSTITRIHDAIKAVNIDNEIIIVDDFSTALRCILKYNLFRR